jgi:hypothetical protein
MTFFEILSEIMASRPLTLREEAKVCESLLESLRNLGRKVPRNIEEYKSSIEEYKKILLHLYEITSCSTFSSDLKEERKRRIKETMRISEKIVEEENITQWSFHLSEMRLQTSNFCVSPIYMNRILSTSSWLRHFKIRKIQEEIAKTVLKYSSTYERRKAMEMERMKNANPRVIISKGDYDTSPFGQGRIVYSLSQFIEPSILLLNQPFYKIEEIKRNIGSLNIPSDVKSILLDNIKKYKIEEIYPGPYVLTLVESKREEITQSLKECISRVPYARKKLCAPLFTWQFFFDAIFSDKKTQVLDCYLIPLGFKEGEIKIKQEKLPYLV